MRRTNQLATICILVMLTIATRSAIAIEAETKQPSTAAAAASDDIRLEDMDIDTLRQMLAAIHGRPYREDIETITNTNTNDNDGTPTATAAANSDGNGSDVVSNNDDVPPFVPTDEWQVLAPGQAIPPGLWVRMDMTTGVKMARLLPPEERNKAAYPMSNTLRLKRDGSATIDETIEHAALSHQIAADTSSSSSSSTSTNDDGHNSNNNDAANNNNNGKGNDVMLLPSESYREL